MKNLLHMLLVAFISVSVLSSCGDLITELEGKVDALDSRVEALEKLTAQMNTNISALQTVVAALQNDDVVKSITEIKEGNKVIGYTLSFSKSGDVTIYNGKDGADGKDGRTPNLLARKDTNGKFYWWLNGLWLEDSEGKKIPVSGENGVDGKDGYDGKNGTTPQLKIENGFWMLSTDNGETWTQLGKATGESGQDGEAPVVGIKKFTDGIYYWTLNGEFMTDDEGNKIAARGEKGQDGQDGQNGVTPKLKIENGLWMVSTDNGETWTIAGAATGGDGDSFFQNVSQDDNYVYMQLKDGTMIKLPKEKMLSISFDESTDISITGGATKTLNYTVTGATEEAIVKALGQNGWRAKVTPTDNTKGTIAVTAPDPLTDDEVLVWVYDGKTKTIMSSLNFVTGVITVASNAYSLPKEAGSQAVTVNTNIDYTVDIPEEAKSWLSVASTRSAMRIETLTFSFTENKEFLRYATVTLKNNAGKVLQSIAFEQAGGAISVDVETAGTLSALLTEEQKQSISHLVVNGTLNDADFGVISQMPSLAFADMSGITNTSVLAAMFRDNPIIKEVKLPAHLTKIPDNMFYNSGVQTCVIPDEVETIGKNAFALSKLSGSLEIPASVTLIDNFAFNDCKSLTGSLNFASGLITIGTQAFGGCSELTGQLVFPATLITISANAFMGCSKFSGNLILPENVTFIGGLAFSGCNGIGKIYSKNPTPPTLEAAPFPNYTYLGVPAGAKTVYEAAVPIHPTHDKWSNFAVIEEVDFSGL